jgi:ABC-2 type transport system permease protein
MIGKIIGTSLAGILQFFIWAVIGAFLDVCCFGIFFGVSLKFPATKFHQVF